MKLNLGCGHIIKDDFINIDQDVLCNPDMVLRLGIDPFPKDWENKVEYTEAFHVLEHIVPSEHYFFLFQEIYRVSKHGALFKIKVPHHRSEIWFGDPTHSRFVTVDNIRHFDRIWGKWYFDQWNSSSGFAKVLDIDFTIVEYEFIIEDYWKQRFQAMTKEEQEYVIRSFNNVVGEVSILLMVRKEYD